MCAIQKRGASFESTVALTMPCAKALLETEIDEVAEKLVERKGETLQISETQIAETQIVEKKRAAKSHPCKMWKPKRLGESQTRRTRAHRNAAGLWRTLFPWPRQDLPDLYGRFLHSQPERDFGGVYTRPANVVAEG